MARTLVTAEAVASAAAALIAAGQEPTIIAVQQRVGGGSFTTIKRELDAWRAARQMPSAPPLPEQLATQVTDFARHVWQAATTLADEQVVQVRSAAAQQVAAAQAALAEAETVIERLEVEQEQRATALVAAQAAVATAQANLARTEQLRQEAVTRADQATAETRRLHHDLATAQQEQVARAGLEGEIRALQRQLDEQRALVERLAKQPPAQS